MAELPQWQSHKKVWGDKIVEVRKSDDVGIKDDSHYRWTLACGAVIVVSFELRNRVVTTGRAPEAAEGGYYVLYADGFESWSPAEAFEEGYVRMSISRGQPPPPSGS